MHSSRHKVLIVDDDPLHLEIYGLMVSQAGYDTALALVVLTGVQLPTDTEISIVILDYKLNSLKTSAEIAQEVRQLYPTAPIILLSDIWGMPEEMRPYITEFVRKGEPANLMATLTRLLPLALA